jgi:radical SAM/Cys-rich protein
MERMTGGGPAGAADNEFEKALEESALFPLLAAGIETLQINTGRRCNQSCAHCHVEAGPDRPEIMGRKTLERCLEIAGRNGIGRIELTGGSPEMNPDFRWFVEQCHAQGLHLKVRSNLTIMLEEGYDDLPGFLARHGVDIIGSLPCYTEENVDKQRGDGVYKRSVSALRKLNESGYGMPGSPLALSLVYNPGGAFLPGDQASLENDYRRELKERHGIEFTNLYTITNMPIGRFKAALTESGGYTRYMDLLAGMFNPESAMKVMCRSLLSVGWDGTVYDCDFNQMLGINCDHGAPDHIDSFSMELLANRRIVTGPHCFGCTAGAGSSCSGALA